MDHKRANCQYSVKSNPNTAKFWDDKILENKKFIRKYPIYLLKNRYVLNKLNNLTGNYLNVGIGYGFLEEEIVKHGLDLKLHGIDISKVAIRNAKKTIKGRFVCASALSLPFKGILFDCVVALDIIEHLNSKDANKAISEINRVMKKNGLLIVSVPTNETREDEIKNGHLVKYSVESLKNLLLKYGFMVKSVKVFSAFNKLVYLKNLVNNILGLRKPNLIIVTAIKT